MAVLMDIIKGRKSVRTYDGKGVSAEDLKKLEEYAEKTENPFGIPVKFVFLDGKEHGLSSPVLAGDRFFVAGIVEKKEYADVAFGYSFEDFVLYAWSLGIGTVWIGGTMKRDQFEKAAGLENGYMMPCMTPIGYPAKKRAIKESIMRKGVKADWRMPAEALFFDGSFAKPLSAEKQKGISDLIEMIRWAPSAVNKQPWRVLIKDGKYHFYEKKDKGYVNEATGDLQKIDVGIALCHLVKGLEEQKKNVKVVIDDPGAKISADMEYIASVSAEE